MSELADMLSIWVFGVLAGAAIGSYCGWSALHHYIRLHKNTAIAANIGGEYLYVLTEQTYLEMMCNHLRAQRIEEREKHLKEKEVKNGSN